jgi:inhibitor of KinA sporulation pathway (predicted exonuclease)
MGAKLDRVLVVDIEATCWKTAAEQGQQPNEIIEIGICALNVTSGEIINPTSYVVKPRFTRISAFCTQLTGWTQEQVDQGKDIVDVLADISESFKVTKDNVWFSCGEYDRIKLGSIGPASLMGLYGIHAQSNPFASMRSHFNVKTLFALKHHLSREVGLGRMLQHIGEQFEGRPHNGADDAYNCAKLVRHVLS